MSVIKINCQSMKLIMTVSIITVNNINSKCKHHETGKLSHLSSKIKNQTVHNHDIQCINSLNKHRMHLKK